MTDNTLFTAQNLGSLTSLISVTGLVGDTDLRDYYRFNLTSNSNINIVLRGDANIRLIRDFDGDGVVDPNEVIASSGTTGSGTPGTIFESINLFNQVAGAYFVEVARFSTSDTNYRLNLSRDVISNLIAQEAGANIGNLSAIPITRFGFVGGSDTSDYYRFSLASNSDINISLTGLNADADIRLIRDANNNDVVDFGEVIATSARGGTSDDSINLNNQAAGNYFVQVYQFASNNTNYTLRLSNDQPSSVIAVQENFGLLTAGGSGITRSDFVGNTDTSDIYRFSLNTTRNVTATISGLSTDADLRLFQDFNSNGIVDTGEEIARSAVGSNFTDSINRVLGAGDYFLQVYQFSGDTSYNLAVNAL